jgi:hypothetical protein
MLIVLKSRLAQLGLCLSFVFTSVSISHLLVSPSIMSVWMNFRMMVLLD